MNPKTLLALILLTICPKAVFAAVQWKTEDGGNGHWYELTWTTQPNIISWSDAKVAAESSYLFGVQGHLATVTSAAENDFLEASFLSEWEAPGNSAWIGLTDSVAEGDFQWTTGEAFSYSNWGPNEPNDSSPGEDYVGYWLPVGPSGEREFLWNDFRDNWNTGDADQRVGYFTEYDTNASPVPEPTALAAWILFGAVGVVTATRRRQGFSAVT